MSRFIAPLALGGTPCTPPQAKTRGTVYIIRCTLNLFVSSFYSVSHTRSLSLSLSILSAVVLSRSVCVIYCNQTGNIKSFLAFPLVRKMVYMYNVFVLSDKA